jgi:hypothetical protein
MVKLGRYKRRENARCWVDRCGSYQRLPGLTVRKNARGENLAGELGFEPRQTESESVVLPLHHSPSKHLIYQRFFGSFSMEPESFANRPSDAARIAGSAFAVQSLPPPCGRGWQMRRVLL